MEQRPCPMGAPSGGQRESGARATGSPARPLRLPGSSPGPSIPEMVGTDVRRAAISREDRRRGQRDQTTTRAGLDGGSGYGPSYADLDGSTGLDDLEGARLLVAGRHHGTRARLRVERREARDVVEFTQKPCPAHGVGTGGVAGRGWKKVAAAEFLPLPALRAPARRRSPAGVRPTAPRWPAAFSTALYAPASASLRDHPRFHALLEEQGSNDPSAVAPLRSVRPDVPWSIIASPRPLTSITATWSPTCASTGSRPRRRCRSAPARVTERRRQARRSSRSAISREKNRALRPAVGAEPGSSGRGPDSSSISNAA